MWDDDNVIYALEDWKDLFEKSDGDRMNVKDFETLCIVICKN